MNQQAQFERQGEFRQQDLDWRQGQADRAQGNFLSNQSFRQSQADDANAFRNKQFDATQAHRANSLALQKRKMSQGAALSYGKSGAVFQGPDGRFYSMQFANDGTRSVKPVEINGQNLTPARGVATVDDGTGTQIINKATGGDVRRIEKDIAGAELEKKRGQHAGNLEANKTKATVGALSKVQQGQTVLKSIDLALEGTKGLGTTGFVGSLMKQVPGTPAYDLANRLNTVKGNIGFDKLQDMRDNSPTGGALGQVSEFELQMLQSVWGSVEQAQSPAELRRNLQRFKVTYRQSMSRIKKAYELDYGKGSWKGLGVGSDVKSMSDDDLKKRLGITDGS